MMADVAVKDSTFSSVHSINKLSLHGVRFYEADPENETFILMIKRVEHDLSETERLLKLESVNTQLISGSERLLYVRGVIINTTAALYEVGDWVERARNNEGNTIASFQARDRWVFNDDGKLVNQNLDLSTCQQALSNVLAILTPLEKMPSGGDSLPLASEVASSINDHDIPEQRVNSEPKVGRLSVETNDDPKRLSYPVTPVQPPAVRTGVKRKPVPTDGSLPTAPVNPKASTQPQVFEAAFQSTLNPTFSTLTMASTSNLTNSASSSMPTSPADSQGMTNITSPTLLSEAESECFQPSTSVDEGRRQQSLPAFKKSPSVTSYMSRHSLDLSRPPPQPQAHARTPPKSSQSWPSVTADNSYQTAQQARRVVSPRPIFLPSKPSNRSLPQALKIGHRPSPSISIVSPSLVGNADVYSDDPPYARHHSNSVSTLPIPAQPWVRQRTLSSTNLLGPLNMFDFSAMKDTLEPRTATTDETVDRKSFPGPQIPPKVPIQQARSLSNLREADNSTKAAFNVPNMETVTGKLKTASKPDLLPELRMVDDATKLQFNTPVELPSNIPQPAGAEEESPSKWRTYNRELSTEPIHTIESSYNPPPEVVGLPVIGPRLIKASNTNWEGYQRQSVSPNEAPPPNHEQAQDDLRRDSGVMTDESVHVRQGIQFLAEPLKQDKTPSKTQPKPTDMKTKQTKTAAEVRRKNRRALLNIMNKGSHE